MELKNKQKKWRNWGFYSSSDISQAEVSYAETNNSPWEEQKEYLDLQPEEPKNLKEGKFDLIGLKGDYEDDSFKMYKWWVQSLFLY